eukprot:CAMPEP_0185256088 /NCGR_PEP_ID=MMETSP1359-20130426/5162_1 /TAXON_ID=552665 /ORGANISM="Bigelowiella longifila, Strain CCMP242" /LENGTH=256 /DNA_ID=CAMNT_0027840435 /DNA_START=70 /DNA_END=837 /DNA_ORIENTATION=+
MLFSGAGFVGSHLIGLLAASPRSRKDRYGNGLQDLKEVRVLDVNRIKVKVDTKELIHEIVGDMCDSKLLDKAMEGVDTVFLVASIVHWSLNPHPLIEKVNVQGTKAVVAACKRHRVKRLIYTSTLDVCYTGLPISDGDSEKCGYPETPVNDYVRTKIAGERIVLSANGRLLRTCALRPTHVYGERDPHAIPTVLKTVQSGGLLMLLGNPNTAKFDFVYAGNVAHAHIMAAIRMAEDNASGPQGKAYIISENFNVNW